MELFVFLKSAVILHWGVCWFRDYQVHSIFHRKYIEHFKVWLQSQFVTISSINFIVVLLLYFFVLLCNYGNFCLAGSLSVLVTVLGMCSVDYCTVLSVHQPTVFCYDIIKGPRLKCIFESNYPVRSIVLCGN